MARAALMTGINELYEPREDSFLLAAQVKKYARGAVLDMCTGSGIQAITAAQKKAVRSVLAVDISNKALAHAAKHHPHKKIRYRRSDLFSAVAGTAEITGTAESAGTTEGVESAGTTESAGTFDTIICNPPYLPDEPRLRDIALDGGKNGYEFIALFLSRAGFFLSRNGVILLVFSSLTGKQMVDRLLTKNGFIATTLSSQQFDFETLYVYKIQYPPAVQRFYGHGIHHLALFASGHRGLIFTGFLKKRGGIRRVAVKMQRPDTAAQGTVAREARVLRVLNRHRIGPQLLASGTDYFIYEFADGVFFLPFIQSAPRKSIKKMLCAVFSQMKKLDKLGLNKEEMHHPFKHILISPKKPGDPVLLDFERCRKTSKLHNVTQFCECVARCAPELAAAGVRASPRLLRAAAAAYRQNARSFPSIISLIKKA